MHETLDVYILSVKFNFYTEMLIESIIFDRFVGYLKTLCQLLKAIIGAELKMRSKNQNSDGLQIKLLRIGSLSQYNTYFPKKSYRAYSRGRLSIKAI